MQGVRTWRTAVRSYTASRISTPCGPRSPRCTGGSRTTASTPTPPASPPPTWPSPTRTICISGAQRVARAMVQHLHLPDARMIVALPRDGACGERRTRRGPRVLHRAQRPLPHPPQGHRRRARARGHACAAAPARPRASPAPATTRSSPTPRRPISARAGCCSTRSGRTRHSSQKLGYLTPEEFGYVLAKRALVFDEDPSTWFTSPQAYTAYTQGRARAPRDDRQPPLTAAGWAGRRRYAKDRRYAQDHPGTAAAAGPGVPYAFEDGPDGLRVSFACPTCHQRIRVPVRGRVRARCALCRTVLDCDT